MGKCEVVYTECVIFGILENIFAAAISLVTDNGINILKMQYDKIKQVSEDTVLASYLAPQKEAKAPSDAGGGDLSVWLEPKSEAGGGAGAFLQNQHYPGAAGYRENADDFEYYCQCCSEAGRPWQSSPTTIPRRTTLAEKLEKEGCRLF